MLDALNAGASALGLPMDKFCRSIDFLSHGTTVGTNTIIQKKGARVGLITTKGHEDAIHIMRGSRGYGGRDIRQGVHLSQTPKTGTNLPQRPIPGGARRGEFFRGGVVAP